MTGIDEDTDLIRRLAEFTGLAPTAIAKKIGVAVTTITRPFKGVATTRLGIQTLEKLRRHFPEFPDWATGSAEQESPAPRDYIPVPILPSFAGMGGGGSGEGDQETGLIPRSLVVNDLRANPNDLLLIDVRGESMEPDFKHGDQILVDCRDRDPIQPGAFALWDGDAYVVKLVERVPQRRGFYRVFSANARYSAYEVNEQDIRIMGRPVWFARRL